MLTLKVWRPGMSISNKWTLRCLATSLPAASDFGRHTLTGDRKSLEAIRGKGRDKQGVGYEVQARTSRIVCCRRVVYAVCRFFVFGDTTYTILARLDLRTPRRS